MRLSIMSFIAYEAMRECERTLVDVECGKYIPSAANGPVTIEFLRDQ